MDRPLGSRAGRWNEPILSERLWAFTGLIWSLLVVGGSLIDEESSRTAARIEISLGLAGGFFAFWFLAYLRARLRAAATDSGLLASVAYGAGLVAVALHLVLQSFLVADFGSSAYADEPGVEQALTALAWQYGGVANPAWAAFVGATSLALLRYRLLARWLGGVGILIALAMVFSGFLGGFLVLIGRLWVVGLAIGLLLRPAGTRAPEAA